MCQKCANQSQFSWAKSHDGSINIEARDKHDNLFKRKYLGYTLLEAQSAFRTEFRQHNQELM